jgi:hypothetical protein
VPLPAWTQRGYLVPGRHTASEADIYERCVSDAPAQQRQHREVLFSSLQSYTGMIRSLLKGGSLLVGGPFLSRDSVAPTGLDVVLVPADWEQLTRLPTDQQEQLHQLLTLNDIIVGHPITMYMKSIKPVGSVVDAYLCYPGQEDVWEDLLSEVVDEHQRPVEGVARGYVEVVL